MREGNQAYSKSLFRCKTHGADRFCAIKDIYSMEDWLFTSSHGEHCFRQRFCRQQEWHCPDAHSAVGGLQPYQ